MGNRLSNPNVQFFDNSGQPLNGGTLDFYVTGTTTRTSTYSNRALSVANLNPIVLDSAGRAGDIFLDPATTYKCVLSTSAGAVIWTKDPVVDFVASINASLQVTAGNPNTQIAGTAGTVGGASASMAFDITNNILYIATTTGTAATTVWTAVAVGFSGTEAVKTTSYTVVLADVGTIITANKATAITFTLTAASTIGAGKLFGIKNIGAGALTISPSGSDLIDTLSSWTLIQPEGIMLYSTGSAWRIIGALPVGSFPNEVTVASAATANILGAASEAVAISGTTTITSFGTGPNRKRFCRATGAFLITYNATSLITPGAQNILTAVGDTFIVISDSSSNARIVNYVPAAGVSLGFRNIARANGGLEVWQRDAGSSASIAVGASTTAYTADRWYLSTGANQASVVSAQAGIANGSQLAARVRRNSGQTGTGSTFFAYPLDTDEVYACRSALLALSFTVQAGANWSPASGTLSAVVYFGTGTVGKRGGAGFTGETSPVSSSVNLTQGGAAQRVLFLATAAAASNITQGEVQFNWLPVGTAGAADDFTVDDVQLEVITSPSSVGVFERLKFEEQLAMCQRHFFKTFPYGTAPAQNTGNQTGELTAIAGKAGAATDYMWHKFSPPLRASATTTTYNPSAANAQIRDVTNGQDFTATSVQYAVANGFFVQGTGNGATAVGSLIILHFIADAGI